ncbi:hypothetical protein UC34_25350 [Pandoraea vervacti]|uniref:DUF2062 domain-containing protein n=1 Tax=Pandoraea vervacti TaxID=656178 RepID=A0ABM6FR85_9BURK|nr:DUF2062 domain-containing protein [Pandoraea vervacti]APD11321.1 hypothetical protein UC34_25350 [Pandoraea vervacti]
MMLKMLRPMRLLRSRLLRPHAGVLLRRSLWQATPQGVAMGLACGVFFGILIPVAQMPVAILVAALLRGNLFLATMGTLITNPLTVPFVYLGAHHVGRWLLDWSSGAEIEATVAAAGQVGESFWTKLTNFDFGAATLHLGAGLATFAIAGGMLAYVLGFFAIRWQQHRRAAPVRTTPPA